jgi:hypothetical protein
MPTRPTALGALQSRLALALTLVAASALAGPAMSVASPAPSVLALKTARIGAPGNPSVGIVPFKDAVYPSCAEAPQGPPACQQVGGVEYRYGIGQLEITVTQWVAFLNTVDPAGRNRRHLYSSNESSSAWPKYGQIDFSSSAPRGRHYSVASPEWADKPYGFANFLRSARLVNSLYNGRLLSRHASEEAGFRYVTYRVRLSRQTERGMYEMTKRAATRSQETGFVVPSQDEWIKAAYYDPNGGGTYSYWKYPTNAGVFGDNTATAPKTTTLNPSNGDFGIDPTTYATIYQGGLSSVGQALTTSPWGTLDQGGNVVEWTDTITPPPAPSGRTGGRVWRRLHGGIANAPAYQLWLSAVGLQPQDNTLFTATYPWLGFRVGVLGSLKAGK